MRERWVPALLAASAAFVFLVWQGCNPAHAHDDPPCYEEAPGAGFYWCGVRKSIEADPADDTPEGTVYVEVRLQYFGDPPGPLWVYGVEDARPIKLFCEIGRQVRIVWRPLYANGYPLEGWTEGVYQLCQ